MPSVQISNADGLFGFKMMVKGGLCNTRLFDDFVDPSGMVAIPVEQLAGGFQNMILNTGLLHIQR